MFYPKLIVSWLLPQLEVGNFHKHLPIGGYFLPKAMLIHVLFQGGLDKQFLLSQQFKYSSYYPRLFEAAFAKKMKSFDQTRKSRKFKCRTCCKKIKLQNSC